MLAVLHEDLQAVDLEGDEGNEDEPDDDSQGVDARLPLLCRLVRIVVVQGRVAIANKFCGGVIVLEEDDHDEAGDDDEDEAEEVEVHEPGVPLVHQISLLVVVQGLTRLQFL